MPPILPLLLALSASPADMAWQAGQKAMEADRFDEAVGQFQLCLRLDPSYSKAHLSLAAAHMSVEQEGRAVPHLRRYLEANPDHYPIRWHLAEVLMRQSRPREARPELDRYLAAAQLRPSLGHEPLIRAHTMLMEACEAIGDEYGERLNRGIGLYLLARRRLELAGDVHRRTAEELLCKSAAELTLARMERPAEARPQLYLHHVWSALAQSHPALRSLHAARGLATPGSLTPAERRDLALARHR